MAKIEWDKVGERYYETGTDHGVLYIRDDEGAYDTGFAWNGLVGVSQKPTGAEATPVYADNIKYLNLQSAEEFEATIEAYTYPPEFGECDGTKSAAPGLYVSQQPRKTFGFCYRTLVGNDVDLNDHAYKLHLVYGALASPSEKAYATVNDSPEATTFSWDVTTTPVPVAAEGFRPTAHLVVDSRDVAEADLAALEALLYGGESTDPSLPMPDAVIDLLTPSGG